MYLFARTLWTILTLCSGPCAFLFLEFRFRGYFSSLSPLMLLACGAGVFLWSLFFLLFHQRYFPLDTASAVRALAAALINGALATLARNGDFLYAGYSIFLSALLAHCTYFLILCVIFLIPRARSRFFLYTNPAYFLIPLSFAFTESVLFYVVSKPVTSLFGGRADAWMLAGFAGLLLDAGVGVRALFARNMFLPDTENGAGQRDLALGNWAYLSVSAILLASAVDTAILLGAVDSFRAETIRIEYAVQGGRDSFRFIDSQGNNRGDMISEIAVVQDEHILWQITSPTRIASNDAWIPYGAQPAGQCRQAASITGRSEDDVCPRPPALEAGSLYSVRAKVKSDHFAVESLTFSPAYGPRGGGSVR